MVNYLKAPNLIMDPEQPHFWQPPVGQEVSAADRLLGQVERVIINPRNRRVTAFVAHGYFPDPRIIDDPRLSGEDLQQERRMVLPIYAVRYATDNSMLLIENSVEADLHPDFNPGDYISPPATWQPPYPYHWEEVLFERER